MGMALAVSLKQTLPMPDNGRYRSSTASIDHAQTIATISVPTGKVWIGSRPCENADRDRLSSSMLSSDRRERE
jgi:hypothetical protein